jgi:predicted PurR-regulated permease PerM
LSRWITRRSSAPTSAAFGFVGVMLAVPVAATIGVLCRFWLRCYLASPLNLDPPNKR